MPSDWFREPITNGPAQGMLTLDGLLKKIKTARATHSLTAEDDKNGFCGIRITFDVPFDDTNYTITLIPDDVSRPLDDKGFFCGDVHFKTAAGFVACMYSAKPNSKIEVGSVIELNVLAIHD